MLKNKLWYIILTVAFAGFVVLGTGFYQALQTAMAQPQVTAGTALSTSAAIQPQNEAPTTKPNSPTQAVTASPSNEQPISANPSPKDPNIFRLLILGDSIAKGTGDQTGKGFSAYLPSVLKNATAKEITVDNAGIDGLESMGLLEQLQSPKLSQALADADLILISIGGNDVRRVLSMNPLQKEEAFKARQDAYINRLKISFQEIRKLNPNTAVVFLGLYNPYEKSGALDDIRLLHTWNYASQQLVEADDKAIFIPSHDLMKYNLGKYLAADGMHPNAAGYQALAQRIGKSLESTLPK